MDSTARFSELVQRPAADVPLDEAALLIAGHDHSVDVATWLRKLDALAEEIDVHDAVGLARALFVERGFAGNTIDYSDPRNSYLDCVVERRLGIPITLSVLMIELGRRRNIVLAGIGLPGHFLVGANGFFLDPFHQGARLESADARELFAQSHPGTPFRDEYLGPVGPHAVLARMLANLVHSFATRAPMDAIWALRLRLALPDLPDAERDDGERLLRRLLASSN